MSAAAVTACWLSWIVICAVLRPIPAFADDAPMRIFVSILPEKYFVQRIGGERVAVSVMVGPGRSPATYEPTPRQLADLSQARLYFRIGVAFEDIWMNRIRAANPQMKIIEMERGITLRDIDPAGGGAAHTAEGRGKDPHVWIDPRLVRIMAAHIRDALIESDPGHGAEYERRYQVFASDLDRLDQWIRELFQGLSSRSFMVFHPSWGYFADAYGLKQIPIESAGKEPGPRTLARVIDEGRRAHVKVIFVQQQFSRRPAVFDTAHPE